MTQEMKENLTTVLALLAFVVSLVTLIHASQINAVIKSVKEEQVRRTKRVYSQDDILRRLEIIEKKLKAQEE